MKITYFFLIILLFPIYVSGQTVYIQGEILNEDDKTVIPYATIGVNRKDFGTVANEKGVFNYTFDLQDQTSKKDTFTISSIGYYSKKYSISELNNRITTIYLKPKITEMEEVVVRTNTEYKSVKLGKSNRVGLGGYDYSTAKEKSNVDKLGREIGAVINIDPEKIYKVEALNFYVLGSEFSKVLFRVCLYKMENGKIVGPSILTDDILIEANDKPGWKKIDLNNYKILLHHMKDIAVTLQWVKGVPLNKNSKYFCIKGASSPLKGSIYRNKSLSDWHYNNGHVCIYLDAKACKL